MQIYYKIKRQIIFIFFEYLRVLKYKLLSSIRRLEGTPNIIQPVLFSGEGRIIFSENVHLGVRTSPFFYTGYIYIEARNYKSFIAFGSDVWVNNNCTFVSEGEGIEIDNHVLIGTNCEFLDSDFHHLHPDMRLSGKEKTGKITIKKMFLSAQMLKF